MNPQDPNHPNPSEVLRCWKQHTCVGCGTVYRYSMEREAQATIFASAKEVALEKLKDEVDLHPCPSCGLYQPEMVAATPLKANLIIAGVGLLLLAVVVGMGFSPKFPAAKMALAAAGVAGVIGLAHACVLFMNPNGNLARNKLDGELAVQRGLVQVVSPGAGGGRIPRAITPLHFIALLLIAGGAVGFVSQLPKLQTVEDLPKNGKYAPGGTIRLTFPETLHTVAGIWNGVPNAVVLNAKELGTPKELPASCQQTRWRDEIRVSSPSQESVEVPVYIDVHIPDDPKLDGKTLQLRLSLNIDYPYRTVVGKTFEEGTKKVAMEGSITLQGEKYKVLEEAWGLSSGIGFLGVVVGSLGFACLSVMLKNKGNPTRLEPMETENRGW